MLASTAALLLGPSRSWLPRLPSAQQAGLQHLPGFAGLFLRPAPMHPSHLRRCAIHDQAQFEVLSEEVVYQRYLTLFNRRVKFPPRSDGKQEIHEFDVIGHPKAEFYFCVAFPFHPAADGRPAEVTLLREYAQGVNQLAYSLPAGAFDRRKHASIQACARAELSEEAILTGGEWIEMLPPGHPGVPEVKWCQNRFTPFLCIGPETDAQPGERDYEEFIEVLRVSIPELRRIMRSGDMMLPSVVTCYWALDELAHRGYL